MPSIDRPDCGSKPGAASEPVATDEQVDRFQRDGVVCLRRVFDGDWLAAIGIGIERNLAAPSDYAELLEQEGVQGGFFDDYCNWRRIGQFQDYVFASPAAQLAVRLMKSSRAIFYHEHVLVKFSGTAKETPWHHDQPYYPVNGCQVCSLWMPLEPIEQADSLRFVRGSHRWGRWFVPRKFRDGRDYAADSPSDNEGFSTYESLPDVDEETEAADILSWSLEPGDCLAFHMLTLHGAPGNRSALARRALATRWLGDDARFADRPWAISPPVTGGLHPGDPMNCDEFPVVWPSDQ